MFAKKALIIIFFYLGELHLFVSGHSEFWHFNFAAYRKAVGMAK